MSTLTGIPPMSGLGVAYDLVQVLQAYKKPLPVAFLAHVLSRPTAELEADIARLETSSIVRRTTAGVELNKN